jgi:hypothetical protein
VRSADWQSPWPGVREIGDSVWVGDV